MRDCIQPSYSPDGKTLCFVIKDKASYTNHPDWREALATISADGAGEPKVLLITTDNNEFIRYPKYSPDGSQIYFCTGFGIKRIPAEGGRATWVIRPHELESQCGSSGRCSAIPLTLPGLCQCDEDESETPDEVEYWAFDFTKEPPGLAVVSVWGGPPEAWHTQIVLMGMDGSDSRPLYGGSDSITVKSYSLSVSPDGKWIAFSNGPVRNTIDGPVYVLNLESLQTTVIADGDHPCFGERVGKSQ